MKYTPPPETETVVEHDNFQPERIPTSETTKFMRWGTQVEQDEIVDKKFIERHPTLLASVNKWLPLANHDSKQKQIERIRRMNISLMVSSGLPLDAEETVIDTIGDAQYSRGQKGFYTKELNTQRQQIKDETEHPPSKRSFWKDRNKQKQNENPDSGEVRW